MADDTDAPNPFAFPVSPEIWETHPDFQGMTLRDWFAGQALAAMPKLGDTDAGVWSQRRAWSMAVFNGRLYSGTLPSGHVRSFEAGKNATDDHELAPGWRHIAAVRDGNRLKLYIDGKLVAQSSEFDPAQFDLSNQSPLQIGSGPQDFFNGKMKDVRIYSNALTAAEVVELARAR